MICINGHSSIKELLQTVNGLTVEIPPCLEVDQSDIVTWGYQLSHSLANS